MGLHLIRDATWMSTNNFIEEEKLPKDARKYLNQTNLLITKAMDLYSAWTVDQDAVSCFFLLYEIGQPLSIVVEFFNLMITANHQMCIMMFNSSIRVVLHLINLFVTNRILALGKTFNCLGCIFLQSVNFLCHGLPPPAVLDRFKIKSRFHHFSNDS